MIYNRIKEYTGVKFPSIDSPSEEKTTKVNITYIPTRRKVNDLTSNLLRVKELSEKIDELSDNKNDTAPLLEFNKKNDEQFLSEYLNVQDDIKHDFVYNEDFEGYKNQIKSINCILFGERFINYSLRELEDMLEDQYSEQGKLVSIIKEYNNKMLNDFRELHKDLWNKYNDSLMYF